MKGFCSTDVFLTLGRRGCGKSHLARGISAAYPRKIIFDSLAEYNSNDGIICHSFDEFCAELLKLQGVSNFTLIYQFDVESLHREQEFNQALRILWYRGNCLILVEEVQCFSSSYSMPHWLQQCLLTGRHRNLALFFTTQRPGLCNKTIISQAGHVFSGSLHEKNDVDYVRAVLGDNAYRLNNLPEKHFLYFRPGKEILLINNDLKVLQTAPSQDSEINSLNSFDYS